LRKIDFNYQAKQYQPIPRRVEHDRIFKPSSDMRLHSSRRCPAAFMPVKRLSPAEMGLSPFLCHRFAAFLLIPILSYKGEVLHITAHMVRK